MCHCQKNEKEIFPRVLAERLVDRRSWFVLSGTLNLNSLREYLVIFVKKMLEPNTSIAGCVDRTVVADGRKQL